eukprot:8192837-Pyramimonas_sp.AAC.1
MESPQGPRGFHRSPIGIRLEIFKDPYRVLEDSTGTILESHWKAYGVPTGVLEDSIGNILESHWKSHRVPTMSYSVP